MKGSFWEGYTKADKVMFWVLLIAIVGLTATAGIMLYLG